MFRPLPISSNSARPRSSEMRDHILRSLIVCLYHESHSQRGAVCDQTHNWPALILANESRRSGDLLGGEASVLIRSYSHRRPLAGSLPDLNDRAQMSRSPMIVRTIPALRRVLVSLRAKKAATALVP